MIKRSFFSQQPAEKLLSVVMSFSHPLSSILLFLRLLAQELFLTHTDGALIDGRP
jgi:hypothetical protein